MELHRDSEEGVEDLQTIFFKLGYCNKQATSYWALFQQ